MTAEPPPPNAAAQGPREFGHFTLLKELGRGAQGVVHLAEDSALGRKVALKMLLGSGAQSKEVRERFQREAKITSKLNHPGICGLYEVGESDGVPYLAMQYVPGRTLAQMLKEAQSQQLDEKKAVQSITVMGRSSKGELQDVIRLIERAARALHAAHEAGLVHRDIKPHNIMVTPDGDPVLLDFGLARDLDTEGQTLTASGQVMGTPAYLAPEQIVADREHIDRRTDVYALGVTLFECVTLQRPYDAPSWDQLYHKILEGAVPNPSKLNPRIPKDLRTVIEVAMEREPKRRYQTALQFAEDLQRVRSYEPITAKAANLLVRTSKWARRRPGRAAAAAFAVVVALAGSGTGVYKVIEQRAMVAHHLGIAAELLRAGEFQRALEAVAEARSWDPDSAAAVELRAEIDASQRAATFQRDREQAFAAAQEAREQSALSLQQYQVAQHAVAERTDELGRQKAAHADRFASADEGAALATLEREVERLATEAERLVVAAEEGLHRAALLEAPYGKATALTEAAFAGFYMERWREASKLGNSARAEVLRATVERHDLEGRYRDELRGRSAVTLTVAPAAAEVFLFRYQDYQQLRPGTVPRLAPVPVRADGEPAFDHSPAFVPGDPCLVVTAVAAGSPAAATGLGPGDLIVAIQGEPAHGVFVHEPGPEPSARGVRPGQRLSTLNGIAIEDAIDLQLVPAPADAPDQLGIAGLADPVAAARTVATWCNAADLLQRISAAPIELLCLRAGEPLALTIPAGAASGLGCEATAYPLVCGAGNRVPAGTRLELLAGSYLLLARADGHETQRLPLLLQHGDAATTAIALLPTGATPPGFVYVPPGPFRTGGDRQAFRSAPADAVEGKGFFISRHELTLGDYLRFLDDPQVRQRIAQATPPVLVPRTTKLMFRLRPDHSGWDYSGDKVQTGFSEPTMATPVMGVSWPDACDYVAWRNERARAAGEPWEYALPTGREYEQAARGADGRLFPWGNRFDPSLTVTRFRKQDWLLHAPAGFEPYDESVYGIRDLAGSREEWLADPGSNAEMRGKRGGSWGSSNEVIYRSAGRGEAGAARAESTQGIRLVARPR